MTAILDQCGQMFCEKFALLLPKSCQKFLTLSASKSNSNNCINLSNFLAAVDPHPVKLVTILCIALRLSTEKLKLEEYPMELHSIDSDTQDSSHLFIRIRFGGDFGVCKQLEGGLNENLTVQLKLYDNYTINTIL